MELDVILSCLFFLSASLYVVLAIVHAVFSFICEIKKSKQDVKYKELTAKECALMNIESDIKYIRDNLKENK